MVNTRIDGNNIFIENCSDEKIKLTNCDELGNVIKSQFDLYNEKNLIFKNCPNLKKITADCLNLTGLEIENCPKLEKLSAYYNKIEKVDLSNLKNLKVVDLSNGVLKDINLADCENLQELYVSNNELEELDLKTDNKKLRILYCSYNKLDWLEITHLKQLKTLHCESCNLRELDCSYLEKLEDLFCFDNTIYYDDDTVETLNQLDVSGCKSLKILDCAENELEELELFDHTELHTFSCKANKLKNLTIKNSPKLSHLDFSFQGDRKWDKNLGKTLRISNIPTNLYIDNYSNLERILFTEEAKILSLCAEPELIPFDEFSKLKEYGLGTENDPAFEKYLDKKHQEEQEQQNFNNPYPTPPTTPPSESEESTIDAANFKVPANKDDLEYFGILAGMRIKGKLVIEGWANLVMLNVGNNLLEHLVVKDCPNLRSVIYSHNKLKRVEIVNCPNLSQEYSYGSDNWNAPELTPEEETQLEQKKEQIEKKQEANDKIYLILQKNEDDVDLDDLVKLMNEIDSKLVDDDYIEKFLALYNKKLLERFPQFKKKQPKENEDKPDYEKLYFELLEKIKNGEITLKNREIIANSLLSKDKKEELYKILANQSINQEKQLTTNYLPYILGGLGIVLGFIVLIRKGGKMKFFKEKLKK